MNYLHIGELVEDNTFAGPSALFHGLITQFHGSV